MEPFCRVPTPYAPGVSERVSGRTRRGPRGVLASVQFRRLYTALVLSSFGDWLGFLATTALATQLVDSFAGKLYATGGVLAFRLLPAVLFGPLAGAVADRWDRRRTMVLSDLLRFLLFLSIPIVGAVATRDQALVYLLGASFCIESVSLFWIPAKEASVPNLVGRERLEQANQLSLIAAYGTAPIAAGVFALLSVLSRELGSGVEYFRTDPVDLALYLNAATFLFAALTVARLDLRNPDRSLRDPDNPPLSLLASLREGIAFMGHTPLARGLLVGMLGALAAGGAIIALGRPFAESVLGGGNAAYGLLFGAIFVGIAAGVALGPRALGDLSRKRMFGPSIVGAGVSLILLALVPNLLFAVVATVLVGAFAGVAYVVGITLLGREVEDDMRGRTFGLVQSLMRIDLLAVTATTPFIAGLIGTRQGPLGITVNGVSVVLLVGGVLGIAVGIVSFRQMDDRRGVSLRSDLSRRIRRHHPHGDHPGFFLVVEGGEGAGKSTQLRLLERWLSERGHDVLSTREPGGTELGVGVRALLLDPDGTVSPRAEALLYAADRAQHVDAVVRPALQRGAVVLGDRYVDSSLAYQGAGRELEAEQVATLSRWATDGLRPDLTVLLDIDPVVGLARAGDAPDRMEAESLAFHRRVRQGFLDLAGADPDAYAVVPADSSAEEVFELVRGRLAEVLPAPAAAPTVPAGR